MRLFLAAILTAATFCAGLHASIIPVLHLDGGTVKAFDDYVAAFEKSDFAPFASAGKLWIDSQSKAAFDSGRTVLEPRRNDDAANGSIHHFTGTIRVPGGTIEELARVMQDYPNYPRYFPPDVVTGRGEHLPDSTPADEHFHTSLTLAEATLWIRVGFHTQYDTHYFRYDTNRWASRSKSTSIRELTDPANPNVSGTYPEGEDHGFLWRTDTYWFARLRDGGVDIEANSITLSRPSPPGFGWYGTKRTKDAVDKMLRDVKTAMLRKP
jgi:hypothetical protein